MANTIITIEVPQTQAKKAMKALCAYGGLPESEANAKQVLEDWITSIVFREERAALTPPNLELK